MDSLTTAQLLRDAQQFYSDSFQDILTVFGIFVAVIGVVAAIVVAWNIWKSKMYVRKVAEEESERIKKEMEGQFKDFKTYVKIALAITKFRDGKPSKSDLEILISQDADSLSMETLCALVYAIRYSIDCLEDGDFDLAKRVDDFVNPLAAKLNSGKHNNRYGALANQILMRTRNILRGESYEV